MNPQSGENDLPNSQPAATAPSALSKTGLYRAGLLVTGVVSLALGILGIFLPLLPTTVFLLIAAACFVRSSPRLHDWLTGHRVLGRYIEYARGKSGIPLKGKIVTLAVLWATILYSAVFAARAAWLQGLLLAIAAGVSVFILTRPTLKPDIANPPACHREPPCCDRG